MNLGINLTKNAPTFVIKENLCKGRIYIILMDGIIFTLLKYQFCLDSLTNLM